MPIPKLIHYVWVGKQPLPPLAEKCLASWQKHLPEYELKRWDETNSPMDHHYAKEMYRQKKWAFVSDYIRFWALEREGGIYLDTDMELLRPLDEFLTVEGFVGRSESGQIESSIIGAVAQAPFIQTARAFYDNDRRYSIADTSPLVLAGAIKKSGDSVRVYDHTYFHPCNEGEPCPASLLKQAYARHHWAESWVPHQQLRKLARRLGVMTLLKRILN